MELIIAIERMREEWRVMRNVIVFVRLIVEVIIQERICLKILGGIKVVVVI